MAALSPTRQLLANARRYATRLHLHDPELHEQYVRLGLFRAISDENVSYLPEIIADIILRLDAIEKQVKGRS